MYELCVRRLFYVFGNDVRGLFIGAEFKKLF
jgi:hypothetical protein